MVAAFPVDLAGPARDAAQRFAAAGATLSPSDFTVIVDGERVTIPGRLYSAARVPADDLGACLLTRHHDGRVRQEALRRVLALDTPWSTPFVVQLVGEYVVEILEDIDAAFDFAPPWALGAFVRANRDFVRLTRQRVASYHDCYYRCAPFNAYVGARLMRRIEAAGQD